ncbi:MAG: molybdenum cofactor biosynthesis protein MoaE [Chloroflexi bacterium]|nr:molybdenum cofactor biosynthesis protein MoaE [Chloroflexota bacterium]
MQLEIRLFATLKDRAGQGRVLLTLDRPEVTVREMLDGLAAAYPALSPSLPTTLVAVNRQYATPETTIRAGDEVALFPPVSGGSPEESEQSPVSALSTQHSTLSTQPFPFPTYFAITEEKPDLNAIHAHLVQADMGAIATFSGYVRGATQRDGLPPETLHLEYEAYSEMAEQRMGQIAREIWERWPLVKGIAIVQRIGKLEISEPTTLVACAAGHRDQGIFEAARYGIDRLKEIVPVWKKEVGTDETVWVEGHYQPTETDNVTEGNA